VQPCTTLAITLTQQGRGTPPSAAQVTSVLVEVRTRPGGVLVNSCTGNSTNDSLYTVAGIDPGTYSVRIKGQSSLAVVHTVTITAGTTTLTTSLLREGDADNSNVVNIADFSILAAAFGKALGQAGYDVRADFNRDGVVNITDFALLAGNFGQVGAG
jgi:hypothetical protein